MATTATVTGVEGPAVAVTAAALTNINSIAFDYTKRVIQIEYGDNPPRRPMELSMAGITTITFTISGANTAIVIS